MTARQVSAAPYLSLVIAARNDDHGGNLLERMQAMIESWIGQAELYGIASEIVVVEWNPPKDRPRLKDALLWPPRPKACEVRFIEVPPEVHARFRNGMAIPLHQMMAKNVGIRRARGEFVLATNLDIIFSAELMAFLGEHRLQRRVMYRMDRHDVANDLPHNASFPELLAFCESHMLRVFAREGEFRLSANGPRALEKQDIVSAEAGIRFGAGWSSVQGTDRERYRWVESEAELFLERPITASARLMLTGELGPGAGQKPIRVEIVDQAGSTCAAVAITGRCQLRIHMPDEPPGGRLLLRVHGSDLPLTRNPRIVNFRVLGLEWDLGLQSRVGAPQKWEFEVLDTRPALNWASSFDAPSPFAQDIRNAAYLHTNACGDFTLLSREDWFSLRAYPEFPIWPMHLDALLCYAAHHAGIRESILREPMRIYHIEHSSGAGWSPEGEQKRVARVAAKGVPEMSYPEFTRWVDLMRRYNAPAIFTLASWGLGDVPLSEDSVWP
ncbi:MAG TPA: hypothetical protein VEV17_09460 [Bryobacteraceae bacterium]|nr:hypothetical protein [Bryobacteraceae bacterium]